MELICPVCGKKQPRRFLIERLCKECYLSKHILIRGIKDFEIVVCTKCHNYFYKNKWHNINYSDYLEPIVKKIVKEKLVVSSNFNVNDIDVEFNDPDAPSFNITVLGKVKDNQDVYFEQNFIIRPNIKKEVCPKCSVKYSNYFEATLQLRGNKKQLNQAMSVVAKTIKNKSSISSEKKVKQGVDLKLTSRKAALAIGNKLKKNFKGELKTSRKLFTLNKQTSKKVYRVTILFRFE